MSEPLAQLADRIMREEPWTVTQTYTSLHLAFERVADEEGVAPFGARILLALADADGFATTLELNDLLGDTSGGSQIRRELGTLYAVGLAAGSAIDGKHRRPGIRTRVTLTDSGRRAVQRLRHYASKMAAAA